MSTTAGNHAAAGHARDESPLDRLSRQVESWYIKQVAHTLEAGRCEKKGRALGLLVVMLTTVIGTSAFSALEEDPSFRATLTITVFGIAAALAAAIKEFAAYGKRSSDHATAAREYQNLTNGGEQIGDRWRHRLMSREEADKQLAEYENKSEELAVEPLIPDGAYERALVWIRKHGTRKLAFHKPLPRGGGPLDRLWRRYTQRSRTYVARPKQT